VKDAPRVIEMILFNAEQSDVVVTTLLNDPALSIDLLEAILTTASDESADTDAAQTAILSTIEAAQGQVTAFDETRIPDGDVKSVTEDMSFVEAEAVQALNELVIDVAEYAAELRW